MKKAFFLVCVLVVGALVVLSFTSEKPVSLALDEKAVTIDQEKACREGKAQICLNVGEDYLQKGEAAKAKEMFTIGCEHEADENGACCFNLNALFPNKEKEGQQQELDVHACEGGDVRACSSAGLHFSKQGNKEEAIKYYKIACNTGSANDCLSLGISLSKAGNLVEAEEHLRSACDKGVGCSVLEDFLQQQKEKAR